MSNLNSNIIVPPSVPGFASQTNRRLQDLERPDFQGSQNIKCVLVASGHELTDQYSTIYRPPTNCMIVGFRADLDGITLSPVNIELHKNGALLDSLTIPIGSDNGRKTLTQPTSLAPIETLQIKASGTVTVSVDILAPQGYAPSGGMSFVSAAPVYMTQITAYSLLTVPDSTMTYTQFNKVQDTGNICTINNSNTPNPSYDMNPGYLHHISMRALWGISGLTAPVAGTASINSTARGYVWDTFPDHTAAPAGEDWTQRYGTFISGFDPFTDSVGFYQTSGGSIDIQALEIDIISIPFTWPPGG